MHRGSLGRRCVRYQGRDYILMGLYYEPRPWRKPRAFFVLRRIDGGQEAPAPAWSGERRKLYPARVIRAGICAVIIAFLLTLPAWIASKPGGSVPPAAHGVGPVIAW